VAKGVDIVTVPGYIREMDDGELIAQLAEAAIVMGAHCDWAQYRLDDRERYIAAASLVEDCMDELEGRLKQLPNN